MNNTNRTGFDDLEFENDDVIVDANNGRIRKIEDGKYVLLIYFICLAMILFIFCYFSIFCLVSRI
jgi:hypothetical protein